MFQKPTRLFIIAMSITAPLALAGLLCILYFTPVRMYVSIAEGSYYQYESLDANVFYVETESPLGRRVQVEDFDTTSLYLEKRFNQITIYTDQFAQSVIVYPICVDYVQATYKEENKLYLGDALQPEKVAITYHYEDGVTKDKSDTIRAFSSEELSLKNYALITDYSEYIEKNEYTIEIHQNQDLYQTTLELNPTAIQAITPSAEYGWFTDDDYDPISYEILYEDGNTAQAVLAEVLVQNETLQMKDGDNTFYLQYHNLPYETTVHAVEKILTGSELVMKGDVYVYHPMDYSLFSLKLSFEDGSMMEVSAEDKHLVIQDANRELAFGENLFSATFRGQSLNYTIMATEPEISTVLPLVTEGYIDERISLKDIAVTYVTGEQQIIRNYEVTDRDQTLKKGTNTYHLAYHGGDYEFTYVPTYRKIVKVEGYPSATLLAEDVLDCPFTITFDNGVKRDLTFNQVNMKTDLVMKAGKNNIQFEYYEQDLSFSVRAYARTAARLAWRKNYKAFTQATGSYISDQTYVTTNKKETEDGAVYWLTHVIINDAKQLKSGLSNDTWGGAREKPSDAAKRLNWVMGTNGSYFNYDTKLPILAGVFIKDGVVKQGSKTNGREVCLKNDGTLFTPEKDISAAELLSQGVVQTWGTKLPVLIANGKLLDKEIDLYNSPYPRTIWAMVKPGEYYVLTAGDGNYNNGISLRDAQKILKSVGCTYARCLDGGGSSSLVLGTKLMNNPAASGDERAVADFIYVTD